WNEKYSKGAVKCHPTVIRRNSGAAYDFVLRADERNRPAGRQIAKSHDFGVLFIVQQPFVVGCEIPDWPAVVAKHFLRAWAVDRSGLERQRVPRTARLWPAKKQQGVVSGKHRSLAGRDLRNRYRFSARLHVSQPNIGAARACGHVSQRFAIVRNYWKVIKRR